MIRPSFKIIGLTAFLAYSGHAFAASEEIQVYMDEVNDPGELGLDVHLNYVFSGRTAPDYPGEQPPAHVFRLTPEFSYGLSRNFELGAYLLSSRDRNNNVNIDGEKLRLKFIALRADDQSYFWGANFEVGYSAHRFDQNPWNAELKGIYGFRSGRWTFAANTNIDWAISGPATGPATLELATKLAYRTNRNYSVGFESYNGLGALSHPGHPNQLQQQQNLFAVIDASIHGWGLNLGIGRGLSSESDKWLVKAIVSVPFNNK